MKIVNKAYLILADPVSRSYYDNSLHKSTSRQNQTSASGQSDSSGSHNTGYVYFDTIEEWIRVYPDPEVRVSHIELAKDIEGKTGQSILNVLVQDSSPLESILNVLVQDPSPLVREAVMQSAVRSVRLGGDVGLRILNILMEDLDSSVRSKVPKEVALYSTMEEKDKSRILARMSADISSDVRSAVADSAGWLEGGKGNGILNKLMKDSDPEVRAEVAHSARQLEGGKGNRILNKLMKDSDSEVRSSVAISAGWLKGGKGNGILNELMKDSDPKVRGIVASAIIRAMENKDLGRKTRQRKRILDTLAKDPDSEVRLWIVRTVDFWGKFTIIRQKYGDLLSEDYSKVVEVLDLLIQDPDLEVILKVIKTAVDLDSEVADEAVDLDSEVADRIISKILHDHPDLEIRKQVEEYVRSDFPDLFSGISLVEDNSCEDTLLIN